MSLNKGKKNKKDMLNGAISNELSDGLMSDFISDVKNHKENEKSASNDTGESKKSMKELNAGSTPFQGYVPMIRNSNIREWWVSLGAFATITILVILLFILPFGSKDNFQVHLSSRAVDNYNFEAEGNRDTFELGKPVYVYFTSKKALKTKTIFINVINLSAGSADNKMSSLQSNINPKWKIVETHFQKEFFESAGKYKIVIENKEKKVLAEKNFFVKD